MNHTQGAIHRPKRVKNEQLCLAAYFKIKDVQAYVLFDSGSTTDAVTPDFTRVAGLPAYVLDDPVTLQLGCIGSHSKINYGTTTTFAIANIADKIYLDIVNLDKHDCILGTPFLRKYNVLLDFENMDRIICGKWIPTLSEGEGVAMAKPLPRLGKT